MSLPSAIRFTSRRATIVPLALVVCCQLSATPAEAHGPSTEMAEASNAFLASLDDAQREKATFDFGDEERGNFLLLPGDGPGEGLRVGGQHQPEKCDQSRACWRTTGLTRPKYELIKAKFSSGVMVSEMVVKPRRSENMTVISPVT